MDKIDPMLRMIRSTPFGETNALLAIIHDNPGEARNQLSGYSTEELMLIREKLSEFMDLVDGLLRLGSGDDDARG